MKSEIFGSEISGFNFLAKSASLFRLEKKSIYFELKPSFLGQPVLFRSG